MCGICGTVGFGGESVLRSMAEFLRHRGPDDEGFFIDEENRIFFGNRRLSIIDVTGGRQPVYSEDRNVVAIQNGEIYNFRDLRNDLEERGHRFSSRTDTEVIPHLYEEYGADFPRYLDGMFAIALWDRSRRRLVLARDHTGIKPLYLWDAPGGLAFGSEIKAFLALPGFRPERNLDAVHFLLNIRFVPGDQTLFQGVRKLSPGSVLVYEDGSVRTRRYWTVPVGTDSAIRSVRESTAETRRLLRRAVEKQLVSDVPLGLYLSGGIDSSSLVAMAADVSTQTVKTYSLGFNEPTDELGDSRTVARAFGTDHHETTISFDALSVFPEVVWHVEEPKENAIQLYVLSRYASKHVKVALSGLGGDELFGGYRIFDFLRPMVPFERIVGRTVNAAAVWPVRHVLQAFFRLAGGMRFDLFRRGLDFVFSAGVPERSYCILRNMWEHDRRTFRAVYAESVRNRFERQIELFFAPLFQEGRGDVREDVLRAEFAYKMVDDFLMNEDRTSMANSLEVRVPFLDKDLVEFAFSIPARVKFAGGRLKPVLKEAMRGILPAETLNKPKWGFTFDAYEQFQKDLRRIARRELTRERILEQGIFNYGYIEKILNHPPHPRLRWHYFLLWLILGMKIWDDLFLRRQGVDECYGA